MEQLQKQTVRFMLEQIHADIQEVKAQTSKTNGRVGKLEVWRGVITGAVLVISAVIVPIFLELLKK